MLFNPAINIRFLEPSFDEYLVLNFFQLHQKQNNSDAKFQGFCDSYQFFT